MKPVNWEVLSKYLANECTEQEEEWVQAWLEESLANRKYFDSIKKVWESSGSKIPLQEPDLQVAWNKVDRATNHKVFVPRYTHYWRIAASFLILTVLGILVYFSVYHTKQIVIATKSNEKKQVLLADGSHIWLNENSTLQYPEAFNGKSREVILTGEAFFEIARNEAQPFQVATGNSITQVLGTSFTIQEFPSASVEIHVVSGKVSFYRKDAEVKKVILQAGEKGQLAGNGLQPIKIMDNNTNFLSWHTGILSFKSTTLNEVLPMLEKFYKKKIVLENQALNTCLLTSSFEKRSLEEVLQTLQAIYGLTYQIKGNYVYLKEGSC